MYLFVGAFTGREHGYDAEGANIMRTHPKIHVRKFGQMSPALFLETLATLVDRAVLSVHRPVSRPCLASC
jgi:hypothetical protein